MNVGKPDGISLSLNTKVNEDSSSAEPFTFAVQGDEFVRNGIPHRVYSGALHYFRVVPEYWEDRLLKYKACGLNTVETYVAWNFHEESQGEFLFEGMRDIRRFIQTADRLGLDVILRPGPYICAEWEFGGFPGWLLADKAVQLRCMNEAYLGYVRRYLERLFAEIGDLQCTQGGPIIAVQIENEYGSYGNDAEYLSWLRDTLRELGVDVLLFTSDGPEHGMLQGGTLPGVLKTANFGSHVKEAWECWRQYQPEGPFMCMEFWIGWFDQWGKNHHQRDPQDAARVLEDILQYKGSFNLYMMHGGTNFGFYNGANLFDEYRQIVTSYDYDALLDEQGNPTEKYRLFREVLARHGAEVGEIPARREARDLGEIHFTQQASLLDNIARIKDPVRSAEVLSMEDVEQNYGWILYRTHVSGPRNNEKLYIEGVRDRAQVFVNGELMAVIHRNDVQEGIPLNLSAEGATLEVLVENLGRINYGPKLYDRKGILDGVRLNNQFLFHWEIYSVESPQDIPWQPAESGGKAHFYRGEIDLQSTADTFLEVVNGEHGAIWLNGFALGRYWRCGPQQACYVPESLLRKGVNEVILFETDATTIPHVCLAARNGANAKA